MAKTAKEKMKDERMIESSGNVFADLGLPDAEILLRKSDLVIGLKKIMQERHLTQTKVAELTGVDQPTLSKLFGGSFSSITIDRLLSMLTKLGHKVAINVNDIPEKDLEAALLTVSFGHTERVTDGHPKASRVPA
jgi:predicted XRE-type DNA-binding protein